MYIAMGTSLILVFVDAAKAVTTAGNTFGTISELHNFIETLAKRHAAFQDMQKESGCKSSDTHWACWAKALKVIKKTLERS